MRVLAIDGGLVAAHASLRHEVYLARGRAHASRLVLPDDFVLSEIYLSGRKLKIQVLTDPWMFGTSPLPTYAIAYREVQIKQWVVHLCGSISAEDPLIIVAENSTDAPALLYGALFCTEIQP